MRVIRVGLVLLFIGACFAGIALWTDEDVATVADDAPIPSAPATVDVPPAPDPASVRDTPVSRTPPEPVPGEAASGSSEPSSAPGDSPATAATAAPDSTATAPPSAASEPPPPTPAGPPACTTETPPILTAIDSGDAETVRRALAAGADVHACMDMGEGGLVYALPEAMARRSFDIARLLLEAGADPDRVTPGDIRPLETAITAGETGLVAALIAADADVNAVSSGAPLITAAAQSANAEILRLLLDAGADPDVAFYGDTPLHIVATAATPAAAAVLVDAGADIDARNRLGRSALAIAAGLGRAETVRLLLDAGAVDLRGALGAARDAGHTELVQLLEQRLAGDDQGG